MPLPHDGQVRLVRIVDADGNAVFVFVPGAGGVNRLAVDAAISSVGTGATITGGVDTAVPAGPPVALPPIPLGTTRVTVQNIGPAGSRVRVRDVGGVGGPELPQDGSVSYGGPGGAVAPLEGLQTAGAPICAIVFEGP